MTFTAALATGFGFVVGVFLFWLAVFTIGLTVYGLVKFFTRKNTEDEWPEHATPDNVPEYDLSELDIPAFLRRKNNDDDHTSH